MKNVNKIDKAIRTCAACDLCKTRNNAVAGEGSKNAELLFIGEAPGNREDLMGKPFCGRSGKLLDKMIKAMGLERKEVYITNVVKCRPPNNRNPSADEIEKCRHFLNSQIMSIDPKVIVTLGNFAMREIIKYISPNEGITKNHGKIFNICNSKVIPTFHPAYLLRNSSKKQECWEDLKKVIELLKQGDNDGT